MILKRERGEGAGRGDLFIRQKIQPAEFVLASKSSSLFQNFSKFQFKVLGQPLFKTFRYNHKVLTGLQDSSVGGKNQYSSLKL